MVEIALLDGAEVHNGDGNLVYNLAARGLVAVRITVAIADHDDITVIVPIPQRNLKRNGWVLDVLGAGIEAAVLRTIETLDNG